jgi:hypothetical protein
MIPSRRDFLQLGTLAVAATAAPVVSSASSSLSAEAATALYHSSPEMLQKHVGTEFVIHRVEAPTSRMLLEAIKEFPSRQKSSGECFVLRFRLIDGQELPEGLFQFQHAALGKTALFITPSDQRGLTYSAVINHRKA